VLIQQHEESLATVSSDYVLDLSHMGIASGILSEISADKEFKKLVMELIAEKNSHELKSICESNGIPKEQADKLISLCGMYGERSYVLKRLGEICTAPQSIQALSELSCLDEMLTSIGIGDKVRFDFSVVNNMKYYNGIVFKGFLDGICEGVLAGGEYKNLLESMRRSSRGIGFALYLDLLGELDRSNENYDVDVLLLYSESTELSELLNKKQELIRAGKTVYSATAIPDQLRFGETVRI
jgi:ATP phosphoribosyltransferase regulatory subunit